MKIVTIKILVFSLIAVGCVHRDYKQTFSPNEGLRRFFEVNSSAMQHAAINEVSTILHNQKLSYPELYMGDNCKSMLLKSLKEDFMTELFIEKMRSILVSQEESVEAFSSFLNTEKGKIFLSKYDRLIKNQVIQQQNVEARQDNQDTNIAIQQLFELLREQDNSMLLENGFRNIISIQGQVIDNELKTVVDSIIKKNELKCMK